MDSSRTVFLAALAILLPTIIFSSVVIAFNTYYDREAVEDATMDRTREVINEVDSWLALSTGSLEVLATVPALRAERWSDARGRAAEVEATRLAWRSVTLFDLGNGSVLFTTRGKNSEALRPKDFDGKWIAGRVTFGGIARRPGRCTCMLMAERLPGRQSDFGLLVELDPHHIQRIVLAHTPPGAVVAVVDGAGRFIGRSLAFEERVGTPGTVYLREGMRHGTQGFYRGKTFEGLDNMTAFAKSPQSGWSAHMAVSSQLVSVPQRRFYIAIAAAALLSLAFATAIFWFILHNLARRRAMELRLRESEHFEALGRLAGGVAHDFNNMLAIVIGNIDLIRRSANLPDKARRRLDSALQGADRAVELTRRMLAYARRQQLTPGILDPTDVVRETCALLERTVGDHIQLSWTAEPGLWSIKADRSELENTLVNLALNARDAMPGGGEILIDAFNAAAGSSVEGPPVAADCVVIRVTDDGEGISSEIIARVTDPFFTTKQPGQGTGLGLSQALGFARQSGGDLKISSAIGTGTRVFLLLPRHLDSDSRERSSDAATMVVPPRTIPALRVMLVEDEEQVRLTMLAALAAIGQEVSAFTSGEEALAALEAGGTWDMIVTDNQMSGMAGVDLVQLVATQYPDMAALLVSALPVGNLPPHAASLAKPFSIDQLSDAMLAAIDHGRCRRANPSGNAAR